MSQNQNQQDYQPSSSPLTIKVQSIELENELESDSTKVIDKGSNTGGDRNRSRSVESTGSYSNNINSSQSSEHQSCISSSNRAIPSLTNHSDAVSSNMIVSTLMNHQQSGEEAFNRRAIESLVKKLREKKDELQHLILAVTSCGSHQGGCVCISRTLDGRLQVAGKKGFPHVIFARIWRWKDLHKNELRALPLCKYAFDLKLDSVCVNPYHYERIIPPSFTPSSWKQFTGVGGHGNLQMNSPALPSFVGSNPIVYQYSSGGMCSPRYPQMYHAFPDYPGSSDVLEGSWMEANSSGSRQSVPSHQSSEFPSREQIDMTTLPKSSSSFSSELSHRDVNSSNVFGSMMGISQGVPVDSSMSGSMFTPPLMNPGIPTIALRNPPLEHWCSISYYEHNDQIGDPFYVPISVVSVSIDGFTDASGSGGSRFCLGQVNNIRRTSESERALMHVGRGVNIYACVDGDVWLQCVSEQSVFVESYFLDSQVQKTSEIIVHKIYPCAYIKVFDLRLCNSLIKLKISSNTSIAGSICQLNDLQKLCHLRLSFVKGWGPDYPRHHIENTPCWIEIRFNHALRLLDDILSTVSSVKPAPNDPRNAARTSSGFDRHLPSSSSGNPSQRYSESNPYSSLGSNSSLGSSQSSGSQNMLSNCVFTTTVTGGPDESVLDEANSNNPCLNHSSDYNTDINHHSVHFLSSKISSSSSSKCNEMLSTFDDSSLIPSPSSTHSGLPSNLRANFATFTSSSS